MESEAERMRAFLEELCGALDAPGARGPRWGSRRVLAGPVALGVLVSVAGCHPAVGTKYGVPPPEPAPVEATSPPPAQLATGEPVAQDPAVDSFPSASTEPEPDTPVDGVVDPGPPGPMPKYAAPLPPDVGQQKYGIPYEPPPVRPDAPKYGVPGPGGPAALYAIPF